ncbi:MAG: serine--tRNA ligase, partial [Bacilli bacterium]
MIDINILRNDSNRVRENMKKKFQDYKLPLVDEVLTLDEKNRKVKMEADGLRQRRNQASDEIGSLFKNNKKEEAESLRIEVKSINDQLVSLESEEADLGTKIKEIMYKIPNFIDETVPVGKDDSENVEIKQYGAQTQYDFDIPYHTDILEKLDGLDLDSARRVSGNGFYYLTGNIARLHSAILTYARDFMINKGFTYVIPPFMIRGDVVSGVMSFNEMDNMMYKIEGEDLYLIGTSEHSMIGRYKDTTIDEAKLPLTLTSYS